MTALRIVDREGVISTEDMRPLFEGVINGTPTFKRNTPLGIVEVNGRFSHYMDGDTDNMWLGFVLGMRLAERQQRQAEPASPPAPNCMACGSMHCGGNCTKGRA